MPTAKAAKNFMAKLPARPLGGRLEKHMQPKMKVPISYFQWFYFIKNS